VIRVAELKHPLRLGEIFETVLAQISQLEIDQRCGRRRNEYLTSVAGGRDAGRTMEISANLPLVCDQWRACVQTHTHRNRAVHKTCIDCASRFDRGLRGREGKEE
jgi:hypothetical protein